MELEIEVFYHSDETLKLKNADVEYSVLQCDTRIMTFYNINCIEQYEDEKSGEWFCRIYSGSDTFIAIKTYDEIKKQISEALLIKY